MAKYTSKPWTFDERNDVIGSSAKVTWKEPKNERNKWVTDRHFG